MNADQAINATNSSLMQYPIVLIHGLFGSLGDPKIVAAFDKQQVYTPDLLGYGQFQSADLKELTLVDQADHLAAHISSAELGPVHLVGHSVGGAVGVLVANRYPHIIASLTSIEGNFTLKDAFWSSKIANMPLSEVTAIVSGYKEKPDEWIASAGVPISDWTLSLARSWLENQPPATIKAQATAVVEATRQSLYLKTIHKLMHSKIPINLIAGSRSAAEWDAPAWANQLCSMRININGVGHLMMAESPEKFATSIIACTQFTM
ncbi:MAG: alpha/beta hydrolase [Cyanobacteria bacterium P01_F01_bin.56]